MSQGQDWTVTVGEVVDDRVVEPGDYWARVLPKGSMLRIVDLEGKQAVDFLCYNAQDPSERYNAADTMKYAGTILLTKGHGIYSDLGRPLFTIVEDTCGRHDTIGGCCSAESNLFRYGVENTPNCRDNFVGALAEFGMGKKDIVANINFFMNVPVQTDGGMALAEGPIRAGAIRAPPGRNGGSSGDLQLPSDTQPCERLQPHAYTGNRLGA